MIDDCFTFDYCGKAFTFFLSNKKDLIQKKILNTKNFYEIDLLEEIAKIQLNEGIICDIGANVGNHSIYFSSVLKKQVYAFEPLEECQNLLEKNIKLNNLEDKVKIFKLALGSSNSYGIMDKDFSNLGASRLRTVSNGNVEIKTLDSLIEKNLKVSLLKIDVEGFETEVIKGAIETIERCNPIIIAESQTQIDFIKINSLLKSLMYCPISIKGSSDTIIFAPNSFFNNAYNHNFSNFLIKNDIVNVRKRIQGQNDQLSKKLNTILTNNDELKNIIQESTIESESNLSTNLSSIGQNILEKLTLSDKFEELKNIIQESTIESESNLSTNLSSIEKNILEKLTLSDNFEELKNVIQESKTEDRKLLSLKEKIYKKDKELDLLQNNFDKIFLLRNEVVDSKSLNYLQNIHSYINKIEEINLRLEKKIDFFYNAKSWKYTKFFRMFNGKTPQKFEDFKNKLVLKYGNQSDLKYDVKNNINKIQHQINKLNKFDNLILTTNNNKNKIEKKENVNRFSTLKGSTISNEIFVGIAAIPTRKNALRKTVESLINQVDKMGIYLNGWDEIPDYLKNPKIILIKSQDKGDIGDAGKFYWIDNHKGYYFTCDDDIVYPEHYVKNIINKIKEYKFKAVIGWHGSLIMTPFTNYYSSESRRVFAFGSNRPEDTFVHILGTGTIGFHTSTIQVKLRDFKRPNMADVFFAELGQKQNISFVVMKHEAKKMISIDEVQEDSINKDGINNVASKKNTAEYQNQLVKKIIWKLNKNGKLRILMVGRFETFKKGGVFKSNHLIKDTLRSLGHDVVFVDSQSEKFNIEKNIDVAIIYPGDPNRPDFESAEKKMQLIREKNIPVCINISYNTNTERNEEIVKKIKSYNANKALPSVFLMSFTDIAISDFELKYIKDYIISLPKTITGDNTKNDNHPIFSEREGIVLGDATKLMNRGITGEDITPWIQECKKLLPHVRLYVFKQYSGKFDIPGVETIPYMEKGFLDWVSNRKLFVCLNKITTFEMTPTEAQIVGTPIVYRPMPQSLNEYVGRSGVCVTTPKEFAEMCAWLYNDEFAWDSYSNLSLKNSETNKLENLAIGLETSVRKIIFKSKNRKDYI